MAEYIFSLNVILISLGILMANQHLSFRNEYLEKSMLPLVCFIPISLFGCITLYSLRLDPSPLTPYVFSIRANKGWGPFLYKYTGEGDLDDEPMVGKEVNGKVMVSYSIYGQPICRDLDDWLDNKPEVKVTN
ncbi:hypothetical protein BH11CYA1_BH11CYA1_48870 [soil metagenome]